MARLFSPLYALLCFSNAVAQCLCSAGTATNNPSISQPTWCVAGTLRDLGTLSGVCAKDGCADPHPCSHFIGADFTITFIAGTTPKPSVDAVFKQNNQNTISIPLPPDLPTSSDGSYHYVFSATVNTDCKTLTTPQMTAASLSFNPPGGGAPTASGSVVMICGGCGT